MRMYNSKSDTQCNVLIPHKAAVFYALKKYINTKHTQKKHINTNIDIKQCATRNVSL